MKARDILYLKLRYSFEPSTGGSYMEGFDCYTQFTIDVYGCDSADLDQDTKEVLIGKARVSLFYLGYLMSNELLLEDLLSNSSMDARGYVGDFIMNRETGDLKPEFYDLLLENGSLNVLYIDDIILLPAYQGYGYGKYIVKDILCRFDNAAGLVLAIVYPLQLDSASWLPSMQYHRMDKDLEYSSFKLYRYFLDLGFEQVERTNYFYINPGKVNEKLKAIDLEQLFDKEYYDNLIK